MRHFKNWRALGVGVLTALSVGSIDLAGAEEKPSAPGSSSSEKTPLPSDGSPESASPPAEGSADEMVCKKVEPPSGTRLGSRKVCMTQREWDENQRATQESFQELQNAPQPNVGDGR